MTNHSCDCQDGTCLEFFKFRNRASYVRYQSLSWLPKKHLRKFMDSGSSTTGYEEINQVTLQCRPFSHHHYVHAVQADYEAGKRGKGCEKA